jgi:hypothetical protein
MLTNGAVNELSNTIDLDETLIKAEALFRRFQRTVEAIDRKQTFPPPKPGAPRRLSAQSPITDPRATPALLRDSRRQSTSALSPEQSVESPLPSPSSPTAKGKARASPGQAGEASQSGGEPTRKGPVTNAVSPELRVLLRRDVVKMNPNDVKKHGGGVGN